MLTVIVKLKVLYTGTEGSQNKCKQVEADVDDEAQKNTVWKTIMTRFKPNLYLLYQHREVHCCFLHIGNAKYSNVTIMNPEGTIGLKIFFYFGFCVFFVLVFSFYYLVSNSTKCYFYIIHNMKYTSLKTSETKPIDHNCFFVYCCCFCCLYVVKWARCLVKQISFLSTSNTYCIVLVQARGIRSIT